MSFVSEVLDNVIAYHQRTKHQPHAMAQGPSSLDWANQPNPFRSYEGSIQIALERRGFGDAKDDFSGPHPLNMNSLSKLFFESLALSGQKSFSGSKWSLRVNPSSGNLHPTEGYLIAGPMIWTGRLAWGVSLYAKEPFFGVPGKHNTRELAVVRPARGISTDGPDLNLLARVLEVWRESFSLLYD